MITTTEQFRMCDVCRLVDFNTEQKQCFYCGLCDAWICVKCSSNWPKRLKAAIKRRLEPGYRGQSDYVEKMENQNERTRADNNIPSN